MNRRSLLATAGTAAACLAGCFESTDPEKEGTAEQGALNASNETENSTTSTSNTEYAWHHETPGSHLTVAQGLVFGQEQPRDVNNPEAAGGIFALDAATGSHEWTYGSSGPLSGYRTPIVKDAVYVTKAGDAGNYSASAIEFDGTERWAGLDAYPKQIVDGVAYAHILGTEFLGLGAIDTTNGEVLWTSEYDDEHIGYVRFDTAVEQRPETVYVSERKLGAVSTHDGGVRWQYNHGDGGTDLHTVSDGVAYFTANFESVGAVIEGEALWSVDSLDRPQILSITADSVVVEERHGTDHAKICVFDATTGERRWSREKRTRGPGTSLVLDNRVYLAGDQLRAFDIQTGAPLADAGLDTAAPVRLLDVAEETEWNTGPLVLVQVGESTLRGVTLEGDTVWAWIADGAIETAIVDDFVIASTETGLYALELD